MIDRRTITETELNRFVSNHHYVHYMKTADWGRFKQRTEGSKYYCLGFYEEDHLVASAMVLEDSFLVHKYCYVPKGPCLDYGNFELLHDVLLSLQEFAENHHAQFLRIDPDVIRMSRTITGEPDGIINNEAVTEQLTSIGFIHRGYNYAYDGSWTNRYTLIVNLDRSEEEILSGFSKPRRTSLNRHQVSGVITRLGTEDELSSLMEFEVMLSRQDGFKPHSREFFESLLDCFGSHVRFYLTTVSLNTMIQGIQSELDSKKYRKDPEARAAKEAELIKVADLQKTYGDIVPIAGGIFLQEGDMSWDLYTYNHKEFNFLKPVDNLHLYAMKDMKALGVKRYDMCGFSGVTSKDDPEYGLYAYKRSFGPEFIEQIGEFDLVLNPSAYARFKKEKSLEVRARHKYWRLRYKTK